LLNELPRFFPLASPLFPLGVPNVYPTRPSQFAFASSLISFPTPPARFHPVCPPPLAAGFPKRLSEPEHVVQSHGPTILSTPFRGANPSKLAAPCECFQVSEFPTSCSARLNHFFHPSPSSPLFPPSPPAHRLTVLGSLFLQVQLGTFDLQWIAMKVQNFPTPPAHPPPPPPAVPAFSHEPSCPFESFGTVPSLHPSNAKTPFISSLSPFSQLLRLPVPLASYFFLAFFCPISSVGKEFSGIDTRKADTVFWQLPPCIFPPTCWSETMFFVVCFFFLHPRYLKISMFLS